MKGQKPQLDWKAEYRRGEAPSVYTAKLGEMQLVVHRYVGYPPEMWLGTIHPGVISMRELGQVSVEAAQAQVEALAREWLEKHLAPLQPKGQRGDPLSRKRRCKNCGKLTRVTTAGCDHCDVEDK